MFIFVINQTSTTPRVTKCSLLIEHIITNTNTTTNKFYFIIISIDFFYLFLSKPFLK